jgi:hypothetical protein
MRGTKAKQIRKYVYGDYSPRVRAYKQLSNGVIISDDRRREYQREKK